MKSNRSFRHTIARQNHGKNFIYTLALTYCSYPRLLIEVFTRKHFGPQYINLSSVLGAAFLLFTLPLLLIFGPDVIMWVIRLFEAPRYHPPTEHEYAGYITWYIFAGVFLVTGIRRYLESRRNNFGEDFRVSARHSGDTHPFIIKVFGQNDFRKLETIIEPGLALGLGIILHYAGQPLGMLLIICSIIYTVSYLGAYKLGDDFMYELNNTAIQSTFKANKVQEFFEKENQSKGFHMEKPERYDTDQHKAPENPSKGDNEPPAVFKI